MDEEAYQEAYRDAKESMLAKDYKAAERALRAALNEMGEHHEDYSLVLSAFGLSQVLNDRVNGLLHCREAASAELMDGEVFLNLACAEWHAGHRKRAIDAIRRGIKIDPENTSLNRACAKLDCRRKCCFGFLPRGHKVNRFFGRLFRRPSVPLTVHSLLY